MKKTIICNFRKNNKILSTFIQEIIEQFWDAEKGIKDNL